MFLSYKHLKLKFRVFLEKISSMVSDTDIFWTTPNATSFPGSLILPPGAPGGKMRDPGNEVVPNELSIGSFGHYFPGYSLFSLCASCQSAL